MKIALIGIYPPPYGGISIHIQRMAEVLKSRGFDYTVYDISGIAKNKENVVCINKPLRWLLKYILFGKEDIMHYHSSGWLLRIIIGLASMLGKKTIVSIHGSSLGDSLKNTTWLRRKVLVFALRHTSFIIADNEDIKEFALSLGVNSKKVLVIPAFIPPVVKEEDYLKVPPRIWDFIKSHKPVIAANAWRIVFYKGIDAYGLDMIVELVDRLKNEYPKVGVVFCLPQIGDEEYFANLNQEIKERGLNEHILFITEPLDEIYPIWQKSGIFVRPTITDGDALSVREALYFKTPVVTSDAVPRPKGVTLFKNRDIDSFTAKVEEVVVDYARFKEELEFIEVDNGTNKILEVYNNLVRKADE